MDILRRFAKRLTAAYLGFQKDEGSLVAAGIAYYVALSFFPLLLVLVAALGWALQWTDVGQDAQQQLLKAIEQQASPDLARQVERTLRVVSDRAPTGGPIGFIVLLISAIAIFAQLDAAFDRIWRLPANPPEGWFTWIRRLLVSRVKALGMLIGVGGFVIAVMVASMIWSAAQQVIEPKMQMGPWLRWASDLAINLVLNLIAFTALYRILPRVHVRWAVAARGGLLAALLWEAGRQALAAYVLRLNYPSAYGIIGSFIAIMLWAYYVTLVIFFGAEYVRAIGEETKRDA